jgi:acetyltransferase-like isoleucine patch superfamily enzyme
VKRKDCKSKLLCQFLAKFQISLDYFFHVLLILELGIFWKFHLTGSAFYFAALLLLPYVLPLALFRFLNFFFPLVETIFFYGDDCYSPWIGYYKLQNVFYNFPYLERVLVLLRIYSPWLRLWGAKIGKNVTWTGQILIVDRANVSIGDHCSFGHQVSIFSHLVKITRRGRMMFYVKNVTIGKNCQLGGYSVFGPGASVGDGNVVPVGTYLYPNQVFDVAAAKKSMKR